MGEPAILPFDWTDPFDLEHQLTEEERLVRDTAEGYAQEKLLPRVTEAYLDEHFDRWSPGAEALLFAAARADHVAKLVRPALEAGQWVLSDRFVDSSLAYQGGAGGLGIAAVRAINGFGMGNWFPDRTLVLTLAEGSERARQRDGDSADRIGGRPADYHAAVAAAFRQIAAVEPERVRLVDASGPPDDVTARLAAELADLL